MQLRTHSNKTASRQCLKKKKIRSVHSFEDKVTLDKVITDINLCISQHALQLSCRKELPQRADNGRVSHPGNVLIFCWALSQETPRELGAELVCSGSPRAGTQFTAELLPKGQALGKGYWVTEVTAGHAGLLLKGHFKEA